MEKQLQSQRDIQGWLITEISRRLKLSPDRIDPRSAFVEHGLDSLQSVALIGDLEKCLDKKLEPTLTWDYPSIEALANYLSEQQKLTNDKK